MIKFILGCIVGSMVGGFITLILYSCVVAGARADEQAEKMLRERELNQ